MIEFFISMYMYEQWQCFEGEYPDYVAPKIYVEPVKEIVEDIQAPVYHVPSRIPTIKEYTKNEYINSVFNPNHPRNVKTNHEGIQ